MPHDPPAPLTPPVPEEVFHLNLAYLLLAQRLILQDAIRAEIVLGVREPLASWLRAASGGAIATLASSPVAIHALRLPEQTAANVLAACTASRWLGPAHLTVAAVERSCE
jgi:flagellar transcriptional activator FlhD